ncbi:hypothetical protein KC887_00745 [Candidatus Kaiserbacteria bacterium]|nr:hypothetical protein [Candidatus Kaiserbacteria bacterium]
MKSKVFIFLLAVPIILLLFAVSLTAQAVDTTGLANNPIYTEPRLDKLLNAFNVLYGALVIVWGYVAKSFNLNAKVNNFVFVVLAGGIVLGGAFIAFGFAKALPLAFTFLSAIGIYDLLVKPIERAISTPSK